MGVCRFAETDVLFCGGRLERGADHHADGGERGLWLGGHDEEGAFGHVKIRIDGPSWGVGDNSGLRKRGAQGEVRRGRRERFLRT